MLLLVGLFPVALLVALLLLARLENGLRVADASVSDRRGGPASSAARHSLP
jgi:hypothetical protein